VAIKPPEFLNRLPSVSELLDKPPVRVLVERWNRSLVASGVRSFLNDLQSDLRRRAADVQLPSLRELAERAASYVMSHQQQSLGTAINASGQIWGSMWTSRPLSDSALEQTVALGREFAMDSGGAAAGLEALLCRLTGAEAGLAVHSYAGAIWLSLAATAGEREVLISHSDVGDLSGAESLPKLAATAGTMLREVGTTNRVTAADYEAGVKPRLDTLRIERQIAAILKIAAEEYRVVGHTADVSAEELVPLARKHELCLIDALGAVPLVDPPVMIGRRERTVREAVAAKADLVIARGDGLIGGPACGIVVGRREVVRRLSEHPLFAAWRLDALRTAALTATLQSYEDTQRGADVLPVWQLLTAPDENLRNRAERIAPQLQQVQGIGAAAAVQTRSPISGTIELDGGCASYGIALTAADGNVNELDKRLRSLPLSVVGRVEGQRVVLDLRTVLPRQDRALVEAIVGGAMPEVAKPADDEYNARSQGGGEL
jgi:L-seryl-tRNA(Ser) seleniumtransferase